MIYFPQDVM